MAAAAFYRVGVDVLTQCPLLLDKLLEAYGASLYSQKAPLYTYLMTVTGLEAKEPALRKGLQSAWKVAATWGA